MRQASVTTDKKPSTTVCLLYWRFGLLLLWFFYHLLKLKTHIQGWSQYREKTQIICNVRIYYTFIWIFAYLKLINSVTFDKWMKQLNFNKVYNYELNRNFFTTATRRLCLCTDFVCESYLVSLYIKM